MVFRSCGAHAPAQGFMLLSSLLASLSSLDANALLRMHGGICNGGCYVWAQIFFATGVTGTVCCLVQAVTQMLMTSPPVTSIQTGLLTDENVNEPLSQLFFGRRELYPWLALRGLLGALGQACAWLALGFLPLAEANTIMFTTPLWTSVAAALLLGQPWGRYDSFLSLCCFAGVILVAAPWKGWQDIQDDAHQRGTPSWHQAVGLTAALGFSLSSMRYRPSHRRLRMTIIR